MREVEQNTENDMEADDLSVKELALQLGSGFRVGT